MMYQVVEKSNQNRLVFEDMDILKCFQHIVKHYTPEDQTRLDIDILRDGQEFV